MTIYLFSIHEEQRYKIKQIHRFANEYLRSWFPNLGSYAAFNNRLNRLSEAFRQLVTPLIEEFIPEDCFDDQSLLDSMPIITCSGRRSPKVATEIIDKGICSSKGMYYHGLKLHALAFRRKGGSRITKSIVIDKQVLTDLQKTLGANARLRAEKRLEMLQIDRKAIDKDILDQIESEKCILTNYKLLISIIGISLVNATMMILCTNNFEAITNPRSFACYCGVAPFEHTSGTSIKGRTRVSPYANKKVKAYLTNAAKAAVLHDPEIKIYYKRKRAEGKDHGTVMNAVKFKIITRAFAVVKRGTPYVKLRQAG